jgi:hypothetical protein
MTARDNARGWKALRQALGSSPQRGAGPLALNAEDADAIAALGGKVDAALRKALELAVHDYEDDITAPLAALDPDERALALSFATMITGYVMVDACGSQWPVPPSVLRIANALATIGSAVKRLRLDPEQIHAYLSRVVLGTDRMEDVIPDEPQFTRLPIIVAVQALAVYCPEELEIWDYLDRIQTAVAITTAMDPSVLLPAIVLCAHLAELRTPEPDPVNGPASS